MDKKYPFKLWISTLLVAPILYGLYDPGIYYTDTIKMYFVFVLMGLGFSLPGFMLYCFYFWLMRKTKLNSFFVKMILNIIGIISIFITMKIIGGTMANSLIIIYSLTLVICSLFFKMKMITKSPDHEIT